MSTTSNTFTNTQAGVNQPNKFENTAAPGVTQQPGIAQQVYDGATSLVSSAYNALPTASSIMPGTYSGQDSTKTGVLGVGAHKPLHKNVAQHTGGVGSLPGTPNEEDVVRLPEERAHPDPLHEYDGTQVGDAAHRASAEAVKLTGTGAPAGAGVSQQHTTDHDRSRFDESTQRESAAAVGATAAGAPAGHGANEPTVHHPGGSNVGTNLDHHHGLGLPHTRTGAAQDNNTTTGVTGFPRESAAIGAGATSNVHNTATTDQTSRPGDHGTSHVKSALGGGTDHGHQATTHDTDDTTSPSSPRKATFKEKVKGEAKIVSGKLTSNAEKVEAGKALKSGNVQ